MGEPTPVPAVDALTESLQLLAGGDTDFFDEFTIDSSDEEEVLPSTATSSAIAAPASASVPSTEKSETTLLPSLNATNPLALGAVAGITTGGNDSSHNISAANTGVSASASVPVSALKKETVMDDPLSAFSNVPINGAGVVSSSTAASASLSWQGQSMNNNLGNVPMPVSVPVQQSSLFPNHPIQGSGSTASMPLQPHSQIQPSNASVANLVSSSSKTAQSLSSTFSSFASKFQDAVSSVSDINMNVATNTTTPVTNSQQQFQQQQQQQPLPVSMSRSNASMNGANYVNRSAGLGGVGVGMGSNDNVNSNGTNTAGTGTVPTGMSVNMMNGANTNMNMNTSMNPTVYGAATTPVGGASAGVSGLNANGVVGGMEHTPKSQVSVLLSSAIGKLLPGEKVIIFLPSIHSVSDSSTAHTGMTCTATQFHQGIGSGAGGRNDDDLVWCCAMTFYRIIVFSYHESDFTKAKANIIDNAETNGNGSEVKDGNGAGGISIRNHMEEETVKHLLESASVSRQFQYVHSISHTLRPSGKRHHVMQMPLASIDRVEKSTEFSPSNTNGTYTNSNISSIGSSMGINIGSISSIGGRSMQPTSYGDSLGGASVATGILTIYGKDHGRFIKFTAPSYAICMKAYESLQTYAFPGKKNLGYLFAFESRRAEVENSVKSAIEEGKQASAGGGMGMNENKNIGRITSRPNARRYDAFTEFSRMVRTCSVEASRELQIQCPWRPLAKANSTYNVCQSYPSVLFGPSFVNDEAAEGMRVIRQIAAFRSGARFQTMSWASRYDGASIWRCAQPKVGLQGNRNTADEMYIKKIGECAALANSQAVIQGKTPRRPSTAFLRMLTGGVNESDMMVDNNGRENAPFNEKCMVKILDLRPKSSAMANRTAGYGYENTSYYKNTTLSFHGIGNIHVVRDAYQKLSALCANPGANDAQWMQLVEDTKWLAQIRAVLSASWQTAFHVRYNRLPVLIHCSHGWDRTSQVSALAQIFLDPYYRTRAGFSCLIEKEFLALGHPLHLRCGHGEGRGDRNNSGGSGGQVDEAQMSPILIQFLDCVFQIVSQYPDYFEFNTKYILLITEHVYSCRFGTLLCDNEREREAVAAIRQRTHCMWKYLESFPELINRSYKESSLGKDEFEGKGAMMMPLSSLLRNVVLWVDRFCMHGAKPTSRSHVIIDDAVRNLSEEEHMILNGNGNLHDDALCCSFDEGLKWKKIAEEKETEIQELKRRLKELDQS